MSGLRLVFGSFVFQPELRQLTRHAPDGAESRARLAGAEAEILAHLLERAGEVCGKDELLDIGWHGRPVSANSLAVAISNLRRHLKAATDEVEIRNLPREGYLLHLEVPLQRQAQPDTAMPADTPPAPPAIAPAEPEPEGAPIGPTDATRPVVPVASADRWRRRLWWLNGAVLLAGVALALVTRDQWIAIECTRDAQGMICAVADRIYPEESLPTQRQGKLVLVSGRFVRLVDPAAPTGEAAP
ncbi:transcriptional regulator [Chitiniphilus shinanonensis]|uniref:transcriptional regulator n=1 Tax=Chitiniphilus shinanonensis TaxID=553088 RepID=UPI00301F1033